MTDRIACSVADLLRNALGDLTGCRVADIGAGTGRASRMLASLGADVIGVEPQENAVEQARAEAGGPRYLVGTAADTGLDIKSCDVVFFSFSLHHCPDPGVALGEARRILVEGGRIAVLEPEASGACHDACAPVDDETEVLAQAQSALRDVPTTRRSTVFFEDKSFYESADELVTHLLAVDPSRTVDAQKRQHIETVFDRESRINDGRRFLPYLGRLDVLEI